MQLFGGEWVAGTLRRLGMRDGEVVESKMVQRRIKAAQQKLATQVSEPRETESAKDWLRVNGVD